MNLVSLIEWAEGYNRRGLYSPIGVSFSIGSTSHCGNTP